MHTAPGTAFSMWTVPRRTMLALAIAALAALLLSAGAAQAIQLTPINNAATLKECSACHIAFPPQMLPMRSWQALMSHLDKHFGEDASLPKNTVQDIARYLTSMAADSPTHNEGRVFLRNLPQSETPLRIVDTPIWQMIHGSPANPVFKRPDITSPANCGACHQGAAQGQFWGE